VNCLIIGAAGFIGRHLARAHHQRGDRVLALDLEHRDPDDELPFPIHHCDVVADPLHVPPGTDLVYYLAQFPQRRNFPDHAAPLLAVNALGAVRAAEAALNANVPAFLFASTGTVYAPSFHPLPEDHPRRRDLPYAFTKVVAEDALNLFPNSINILSARFFGVFGPRQNAMLVHNVAQRVRAGEPVLIEPNPHAPQDLDGLRISLTFIDDLVRCLLALADRLSAREDLPPVLNVAGDEPVSIRRLAAEIGRVLGLHPSFDIAPRPRRSDYIADISRLTSLINPRFTPFHHALAKTLASYD